MRIATAPSFVEIVPEKFSQSTISTVNDVISAALYYFARPMKLRVINFTQMIDGIVIPVWIGFVFTMFEHRVSCDRHRIPRQIQAMKYHPGIEI